MNYGHPLEFGTFITPSSSDYERVIALANQSESLGFDLITFQDHPYQPAHLDTWTLLSWIAGTTERIRIAANVLNLPLRDPALIARSAASLDLLSGGRFELALGAGAFWTAVNAMGGPKRSPHEAVGALREAIDVVRGMLNVGERGAFKYDGEYYSISGAQRGPMPAHDILLWIGGYKPNMLRLIGEHADGWLPTLGFLGQDGLVSGNAIIDDAAAAAGRDPREIRRILNITGSFSSSSGDGFHGPPEKWIEDLLPMVVDHGVGTFILMSDDVQTIETFATEVAPELRDAAERVLPGLASSKPVRRASLRAQRHSGIDYDLVPPSLEGRVIEPGDYNYARVRSTYIRGGSPGIVLQPENKHGVIDALAFARSHSDLPLSIRSRGHGISGRSTNKGGIVIDLSRMNSIEVIDETTRRIRLEPGARWMDVALALAPYGWALSSGDYGGVGVGGLATAGGIGWLSRKYGLTIDHLCAAEIVLADGSVVRASEKENPDLFWAIRGAGANFGVVTSFEFEAYEVGNVGWAQFVLDASNTADLLERWGAAVESAPRELTSFIILGPPRLGQPSVAQVMAVVDSDDPDTIIRCLQPIAEVAPLLNQQVVITPYAGVMANAQGSHHDAVGEPSARSGLVPHISPEFAAASQRLLQSGAIYFYQIRSVGGAVADVSPDATAYVNRTPNFSVTAFGPNENRVNTAWDELVPYFDGLYISFETDLRPERLHEAFPGGALERLRELKQRYDPDNLFRDNFNVVGEHVRTR